MYCTPVRAKSRCFFEWVYFANVASEIDGSSVYRSRAAAGKRLAEMEDLREKPTRRPKRLIWVVLAVMPTKSRSASSDMGGWVPRATR